MCTFHLFVAGSLWHGYQELFQILVRVSSQIKQSLRKMVHFVAVQGFMELYWRPGVANCSFPPLNEQCLYK